MDNNEKREFLQAAADAGIQVFDITDQVFGGQGDSKPLTREDKERVTAECFSAMSEIVAAGQAFLNETINDREGLHDHAHVDEIAMMFSNEKDADEAALSFTMASTANVFNVATDHVHTGPHSTHYDVAYRFVQNGLYDWRVEMMSLTSGFSPLHEAFMNKTAGFDEGEPVHLSWKCNSEEGYQDTIDYLHHSDDYVFAQSCRSEYGLFSYWRPMGTDLDVFLKPRVNTRDDA